MSALSARRTEGHTVPLAAFRRYFVTPDDSQPRTMRAHGIMRSPYSVSTFRSPVDSRMASIRGSGMNPTVNTPTSPPGSTWKSPC